METTKNKITLVFFKGDSSKVKFFKHQTVDLRAANKMMVTDFAGVEYNPNFDAGVDGFQDYLHNFTNTNWDDFSEEQIDVIKDVFSL